MDPRVRSIRHAIGIVIEEDFQRSPEAVELFLAHMRFARFYFQHQSRFGPQMGPDLLIRLLEREHNETRKRVKVDEA